MKDKTKIVIILSLIVLSHFLSGIIKTFYSVYLVTTLTRQEFIEHGKTKLSYEQIGISIMVILLTLVGVWLVFNYKKTVKITTEL